MDRNRGKSHVVDLSPLKRSNNFDFSKNRSKISPTACRGSCSLVLHSGLSKDGKIFGLVSPFDFINPIFCDDSALLHDFGSFD